MEDAPVSVTYGFTRSLPAKLERLVSADLEANHELQLSKGEKKKILRLKGQLQQLIDNGYLLEPSEVEFPASAARCWVEEVRELSYDIADFHDELVNNCHGFKKNSHRSRWITSEISRFRTCLKKAIRRYEAYILCKIEKRQQIIIVTTSEGGPVPPPPWLYGLEAASPVGIGDSMDKIEKWLTEEGEPRLRAVAVVGPGGVGKTTLAKEIYSKLGKQFECRAFVRSSQMPDVRKLLTSILLQVRPHRTPDVSESCNLATMIKAHLQQKKYFIIIDDLWALSTWDLIHQALPDDNNCYSRILTTTEVDAVAHRCCGHNSKHILRMEPLNNGRSHELFSRFDGSQLEFYGPSSQISSDNSTPSFIKEISSEIISKCGGFPLAIVSIASLLATQPRDKTGPWNYIWSYLSSNLMTKSTVQGVKHVLSLCYDSLPDHLKTCLLYLSLYKEDHIIWKDDLVKQWIAEGFICVKDGEDMDEVGSTYFDELITKGMIQPVHNSHNGEVLSITVHYIVLQFIQCKSIEENFLIAIYHTETNIRLADKVHRLSLHFGDAEDAKPLENLRLSSQVRSLAFFGHFRCMKSLVEFRFLRVLILDLWGDKDNKMLDFAAVCMLRYLEIKCNVTLKLQIEQQSLQYLETLKIDSRISEVPEDIVQLPCLLHLTLPGETNLSGIGCMTSLRTFGCFDLSTNSIHNVKSLEELTNLHDLRLTCSTMLCENYEKNLGLIFSSVLSKLINLKSLILIPAAISSVANGLRASYSLSNNISLDCSSPPEFLEKLELSPKICIFPRLPSWIGHLGKLSILKIASRELNQSDIDILKKLYALSALLLYIRTAPQERIVFHDGLFPKLKHFKFICSRFCLKFEKGALPEVRRLKLGFNTNRLDICSPADAGITNLESLTVFYTKIGCASGRETDRHAFWSALEDAFSSFERRPIINVHLVDSIFYGDKEMTTVAETEQPQTLEKADVVINEGPKDQYETRDMDSLQDKNSRAGRLTRSSDSPLSTENAGENEKTWTYDRKYKTTEEQGVIVEADSDEEPRTQKNSSGKDTRKDAESWTSMASEPFSYTQNQGSGSTSSSKNTTDTSTFGTKTSGSSSTCTTEIEIMESSNLRKFTFNELKGSTRNFRPDSVLGEGGFGSVYKGWMEERTLVPVKPGTGMAVAVKRLKLESTQGHRQWLAEVNYLGQLSHPNLVKLIGYCLEDEQRLLVYEFMPRGSLDRHLFRRGSHFQPLPWNLRMKVALEAARGLAFLHSDQVNIIFRDFKSANILLGREYNAKLSDFGLAKDGPSDDKSHVSTRVMGTMGYRAPEYVSRGQLKPKSDVYSYGVLLLELLSGQRAFDTNRPPAHHYLVEWFRPYISILDIISILDSRLGFRYSFPAARKTAALALQCLSEDAKRRPDMDEVVTVLEDLQEATGTGKAR